MSKYKLLDELGRGGMGVVYRALQVDLGRPVAIKFLQDTALASGEALLRFQREVKACTELSHPNVIKILDFGQSEDKVYYVMELIEGARSLDRIIEDQAPLERSLAAHLLDQLLDALDYCHGKGFIHRDVKPANCMVKADHHLVLMDFGLVKPVGRTVLTQEGQRIGTPRYLAPETLRGEPPAPAADVFAAGALFYELLTARHAFTGHNLAALASAILTNEPLPVSTYRSDLPAGTTDALVSRFLAKDPTLRFASAGQARAEVASWNAGSAHGAAVPARRSKKVAGLARPPDGGASPGARPRRRLALAVVLAVTFFGLASMLGVRAFLRTGPLSTGSASPTPLAGRVAPDLEWRATCVTATWRSDRMRAASLEVVRGDGRSCLTTGPAAPAIAHRLTVRGLEPGTPFRLRGLEDGVPVFDVPGSTRTLSEAGRAIRLVLDGIGPWSMVSRLRADLIAHSPGSAPRAARARVLDGWKADLWSRARTSRLTEAVDDFAPVRDPFFRSRDVPLAEKVALYRLLTETRELEDVERACGCPVVTVFERLSSGAYGPASWTQLERSEAVTVEFRHRSSSEWVWSFTPPVAGGWEPVRQALIRIPRVQGQEPDRLVTWTDLRHERFRPSRGPGGVHPSLERWRSEPQEPLPLPLPDDAEAAELLAVVEGLAPTNPLRVFLAAPGGTWNMVADLRSREGGLHHLEQIWHGLDPRLLVPGAKLSVEILYSPESTSHDQAGRIRFLSFRWTARKPR